MLRLAFDFIITWRETRTRPNAYHTKTNVAQQYEQYCRGTNAIKLQNPFHLFTL